MDLAPHFRPIESWRYSFARGFEKYVRVGAFNWTNCLIYSIIAYL